MTLILVSGIAVFAVSGITMGICVDAVRPAETYCESRPMIGVAGVWIAWTGWGRLTAFSIWRLSRWR